MAACLAFRAVSGSTVVVDWVWLCCVWVMRANLGTTDRNGHRWNYPYPGRRPGRLRTCQGRRGGRPSGWPAQPQLRVDVAQVPLDGAHAEVELGGYLIVRPALGHQAHHLALARGQAVR